MEKCYEYFVCTKKDCPAYGRKDVKCWEIEATLCHDLSVEHIQSVVSKSGFEKCHLCIYFKTLKERENLIPED